VNDEGRVLVHCHAGCADDHIVNASGLSWRDLAPPHEAERSRPPRRGPRITIYEIRSVDGTIEALHKRVDTDEGKKLFWLQPDGTAGLKGRKVVTLPCYGAHRLVSRPGERVTVTEGESAADALTRHGILAVGTVTGADKLPCDAVLRDLLGRPVVLWPDADPIGRQHMAKIATRLRALGVTDLRRVEWPDASDGGDAADFLGDVGPLLDAAVTYEMPDATPEETPRDDPEVGPVSGAATIPLAALVGEIRTFVRRFVVLTPDQTIAIALWIAHTWAFAAFDVTPYLHIKSPMKRSGKTRLLEVLNLLVRRPWLVGRASVAVLIRKIAAECPTLLLDEIDAAIKSDKEYAEHLRGMLNNGQKRSGVHAMMVGQGATMEPRDFPVFCPKAIAGIGELPGTVADRAIPIALARKIRSEIVERFRERDVGRDLPPILDAIAAWAPDAIGGLREARPALPSALNDRAQDAWEPLLAIADAAGGIWPDAARRAAGALMGSEEDDDLGVELLRDLRDLFTDDVTFMASKAIIDHLNGLPDRPWATISKGRSLTGHRLAIILKAHKIVPVKNAGSTARGYFRDQLVETFSRYLDPARPDPGPQDDPPNASYAHSPEIKVSEGSVPQQNGPQVDFSQVSGKRFPDTCENRENLNNDGLPDTPDTLKPESERVTEYDGSKALAAFLRERLAGKPIGTRVHFRHWPPAGWRPS
jgi:hypothetical protein